MFKIPALWALSAMLLAGASAHAVGVGLGASIELGELGVSKKPSLSAQDKIDQGESIQKRGSQLAERITKMLDSARRDKDIMRANCLNRKLTEVNANVRNVEGRLKALRDARNGNDENRANHEFTVLSVIAQKFDTADQEASQCLGQDVYESGASQIVTTIPEPSPTETSGYPDPMAMPPTAPPPPTATPTPGARDMQVQRLKAAGLLASEGTPNDKQVKDAQKAFERLTQERLQQLNKDVKDSENQVRLRTQPQNSADSAKQKADVFLGRNWIDRNGYVVQLSSKVLRPDANTVTKVDYTYRAEGPQAGTSVLANRVSFNLALPEDWTVVYSRGLNDPANLGGGSPEYWRTLQQVSAYSPGTEGCLICFTKQYLAPGPVAGGSWGQPYTYSIKFNGVSGGVLPGNQLVQQFAADGSLMAGSPTLSISSAGSGLWQFSYDSGGGPQLFLGFTALRLFDLGRTQLKLDGAGGLAGWDALREQLSGLAGGSYIEIVLTPTGSQNSVDLLLSPAAFLEAF